MRRRFFPVFLLLAALGLAPSVSHGAGAEAPTPSSLAKGRLLEAEYSLASKSKFYVVFDLDRKEVQLKARGSIFRTWRLLSFQQVGPEIPVEVLPLIKRTYAADALRVRIKPPEGGKDEEYVRQKPAELAKDPTNPKAPQNITAPKFDALEISDMPANYDLTFAKNLVVKVTAPDPKKETGVSDKLKKLYEDAKATWALYNRKKDPGQGITLNVSMNELDAKALYWALGDTMNVIFWALPK